MKKYNKQIQHKEKIEFRGKLYKSINKIADEVGIPSYTLNHRIRQGMSLEEAIAGGWNKREIEYRGVIYESIKELGAAVGISANVLSNRLMRGMTVEESVETPVKKRTRKKTEQMDA